MSSNSSSGYWLTLLLLCGGGVLDGLTLPDARDARVGASNSIAGQPGQPLYYLLADAGTSVGPRDELRRTNRSLLKWWDDLFASNNGNLNLNNLNCPNGWVPPVVPPIISNNNNCNNVLQDLDPFKQMKLFKKLPDLWNNNNNCAGPVPDYGYAAPQPAPAPAAAPVEYGAAPVLPPAGGYEPPNPAYNGPGDGDAGYVAPAPAPAPAPPSYEPPAPVPAYVEPAPADPAVPASPPDSYSQTDDYGPPSKIYGSQQLPQIVYQPIIYLTASPGNRAENQIQPKQSESGYEAPTEAPLPEEPSTTPAPTTPTTAVAIELPASTSAPEPATAPTPAPVAVPAAAPAPCSAPACGGYLPIFSVPFYGYPAPVAAPPAPVYAAQPVPAPAPPPAPAPVYTAPTAASYHAAPPAAPSPPASYHEPTYHEPAAYHNPAPPAPRPAYAAPSCQTPIRLSLIDQPYRVAPELFQEYNYRLALAEWNGAR